jgi:hypothetical protein
MEENGQEINRMEENGQEINRICQKIFDNTNHEAQSIFYSNHWGISTLKFTFHHLNSMVLKPI